jgi:AcrR family transcriptional regulator
VSEELSLVARHAAVQPRLGPPGEDRVRGQRARLLYAMTEVVAAKGFAGATVRDVVGAAGVSRSTFYEQFASKEDCFLEAYAHGVDVLLDEVRAAVAEAGGGWREQLRAGIRAYLHALAGDPRFARTYLGEVHAAGAAGRAARARALRRFADRYRAAFEHARAEGEARREPAPDALFILCAGTEQLIAERLARAGDPGLAELEDVFCDCAEAVLLGAGATRDPQEA